MPWIALSLPNLPLEIFLRGVSTPEPFAVAEGHHVHACDRKAALRGVKPGIAVSAARLMTPSLMIKARDRAAETEAQLGLAAWAMAYTPAVALEFPHGLLLDISGSLKLLGGLEAVLARMQRELAAMGFSAAWACAPTPRAAWWLACFTHPDQTSTEHTHAQGKQLELALATLPCEIISQDEGTLALLDAIGAATLGDILALPRDGLIRRFGRKFMGDIDCALGRQPDPRTFFQPPAQFQAGMELPAEVSQAEALLFAAKRLFAQLAGFLAARSAGIQRMQLRLQHREKATLLAIGLVAPSRDAGHFTLLLREQLANHVLREPVRAIALSTEDLVPLAGKNLGLLAEDVANPGQSWERLVEKLRARLGNDAVQGLGLAADHRPEQAGTGGEPGQRQLPLSFGERPFWLLDQPRPLREINAAPHHEGPLELLAGPERIESGWWDGEEAMRDYFVARSPDRSLLWIYRQRHPGQAQGWFLHGLFS